LNLNLSSSHLVHCPTCHPSKLRNLFLACLRMLITHVSPTWTPETHRSLRILNIKRPGVSSIHNSTNLETSIDIPSLSVVNCPNMLYTIVLAILAVGVTAQMTQCGFECNPNVPSSQCCGDGGYLGCNGNTVSYIICETGQTCKPEPDSQAACV
jgi:hypothetical protein